MSCYRWPSKLEICLVGPGEADHQNWKAAKALLVIIPLLGITYLITILGLAIINQK